MSKSSTNNALLFSQVPEGFPVPGKDVTISDLGEFDPSNLAPESIALEVLYVSLDPYQRGRMRPAHVKSYFPAFTLGTPLENTGVARVIASSSAQYKAGDIVRGTLPFQQYFITEVSKTSGFPSAGPIEVLPLDAGPEDLRHWLGALGMPGLTAYSSLYAIGKPKKGETIFISSAAGAVGQLVGQLAKHEGLRVIGSVGSDEKADFVMKELNFDACFNYKKEKALDALKRLAPDGLDIYYENVGGEQLSAAIEVMNNWGRIVACGMISQYNLKPDERYGVTNLALIVGKRVTMRGFLVSDDDMGPVYSREHRQKVGSWLREGTFKAKVSEWDGLDNGGTALLGMLKGENFGKAVLKIGS